MAYAKVGQAAQPMPRSAHGYRDPVHGNSSPSFFQNWLFLLVLVTALAVLGNHLLRGKAKPTAGAPNSIGVRLGGDLSKDQLAALAAITQPQDIVLYGTSWCPNCAAAKQWMGSHGFRYQECDVEKVPACTAEFRGLGADGVPYLVVKGHHMKDGFDSDEFIAALSR